MKKAIIVITVIIITASVFRYTTRDMEKNTYTSSPGIAFEMPSGWKIASGLAKKTPYMDFVDAEGKSVLHFWVKNTDKASVAGDNLVPASKVVLKTIPPWRISQLFYEGDSLKSFILRRAESIYYYVFEFGSIVSQEDIDFVLQSAKPK